MGDFPTSLEGLLFSFCLTPSPHTLQGESGRGRKRESKAEKEREKREEKEMVRLKTYSTPVSGRLPV